MDLRISSVTTRPDNTPQVRPLQGGHDPDDSMLSESAVVSSYSEVPGGSTVQIRDRRKSLPRRGPTSEPGSRLSCFDSVKVFH